MSKNVFISWSGQLSYRVASVLYEWLPSVIQSIDPFLSSEDIEKGVRWFNQISGELEQISFGIICVTPDNLSAPWILFEAGALSKSVGQSRVTPLLVRVSNSDLQGPLAQFNTTSISEADFKRLIKTINIHLGEKGITEKLLDKTFDITWPILRKELDEAFEELKGGIIETPNRSQADMLEEILLLTRNIAQHQSEGINIQSLAKLLVEKISRERPADLYKHLRQARLESESLGRRLKLLRPDTEADVMAALWWMIEQGDEEDLSLLQEVENNIPFSSDAIKELISVAKTQITERVLSPKEGNN
jgi:hypothetical protein